MSAVDRLAAALGIDVERVAEGLLANPDLADAIELGLAWAEAEAALPEGWRLQGVERSWFQYRWVARIFRLREGRNTEIDVGPQGDTPAEALRALAEKLRVPA